MPTRLFVTLTATVVGFALTMAVSAEEPPADENAGKPISYYRQIRPIFQAHCHGCHQPARRNGEYEMTVFADLVKGGESEEAAIVPGMPAKSYLIDQIKPAGGKAAMPKGKPPLSETDLNLVTTWIQQGAIDDTPAADREKFTAQNPPKYELPPIITALAFSPDGKLLAVSGFHEVLLHDVTKLGQSDSLVGRLVGLSERIESVAFSPDGSQLAVAGGSPGRMGEIQIWKLDEKRLTLSVPTTFDTVYGAAWSPDAKFITYGAADNSVRGIDTTSGEEILFMGSHSDWVRDTIVSRDGKQVISVSRDMTVKLTDVVTQRFLGNITTHTPGVLRGGMIAVDRHPSRNEVIVGGADGQVKLFRLDVKAAPAGGGNPNQIREYPRMQGRIFDVAMTPDGKHFVAGSSLDGTGRLWLFETDTGKKVREFEGECEGLYAVSISPDGKTVTAGGFDGNVYVYELASGKRTSQFVPVSLEEGSLTANERE